MYCHGLISLLMVASVASLSLKSNVLGRPPPPIFVDNDARVQRSGIADDNAEGLYQGDVIQTGEQRRELLSGKVIAHSANCGPRAQVVGSTLTSKMSEPRYVRVTPVAVDIGTADLLSFKQVYQNVTSVTNALMGGNLVFPSSSTFLSFLADKKKPGNKFSFNMEVVNSKCHQIINIPRGVTCTLSIPKDYPPGTICEWWIKAPPGRKVSVNFSRFNVGHKQCLEDFVAIDTTGDSHYTNATRYCGGNQLSPGTVTSTSNLINILMNGRDGLFGGFNATYTVV